eukprot:823155-Amphidinium_carterae.1
MGVLAVVVDVVGAARLLFLDVFRPAPSEQLPPHRARHPGFRGLSTSFQASGMLESEVGFVQDLFCIIQSRSHKGQLFTSQVQR